MRGQFFLTVFLKLTGGTTDSDGVTLPRLRIFRLTPFLILWWGGIFVANFFDFVLIKLAKVTRFYSLYLYSSFRFKGKIIKRPKDFKSKELREAFDEFGYRAATLVGPNGQEDGYWPNPAYFNIFDQRINRPLIREARQKVLDFLVREGILLKRWRLMIEEEINGGETFWKSVPIWDPGGNKLEDVHWATRLTDGDKAVLIGQGYARAPLFFQYPWQEENFPPMKKRHTLEFKGGYKVTHIEEVPDLDRPQTKEEEMNRRRNLPKYKVTENDFTPVYIRPREIVL